MLGPPFKMAERSQPREPRRLPHPAAGHPSLSVLLRSVSSGSPADVSVSGWGLMFHLLFLQVLHKYLLQGWRGERQGGDWTHHAKDKFVAWVKGRNKGPAGLDEGGRWGRTSMVAQVLRR